MMKKKGECGNVDVRCPASSLMAPGGGSVMGKESGCVRTEHVIDVNTLWVWVRI
jgi:hypothetical protein